ncbi:bifunctional DNA-formamidopyrimidine glycosylase/DNA-(apurinic or apyrimidinic site) lyase [Roseospirillum parvum]|uniref:Formamidopyrimidine-DNA glycosylase n=1 Tax=Roseospirillum parvum TaxID=83401 RepID=A0A1G7WHX6_9PROT|nr:bifunctional DNA-formamidopyrimidine glycosylase/DNA-(apurinic or apyrimidinic site) lyase [Roseospirillum parvum]SDG71552.1 formamidopyrimidine-DNA glycosylase [Roseospirillum parvum]
MPELPEVETVRRGLAAALEGRRLAEVAVLRPGLRIPFPPDLAEALSGRRVVAVRRRAKFFQLVLDDGRVLLGHLGMSGRVHILPPPHLGTPPPPGPHDHLILTTDTQSRVVFTDARRFGLLTLTTEAELATHPMLTDLGPEPLSDTLTGPWLAAALAGRRGPIKPALMDQRLIAGIGNIYASEALFRAGLSPRRRADTVKGQRAARLAEAIKQVLTEAIAAGGASLRDHRQPDGELGYFQFSFAVYDKAGQPCPGCDCDLAEGGGIRRLVQAGRSTFYCPRRQR